MENSHEIISLFPIPVLKTKIPNKFSSLVPFFFSQPLNHEKESQDAYGVNSVNTYILNQLECKELGDYILDLTLRFATENFNYSHKSYKFSQSWISVKKPTQFHAPHFHSNSLISGVLYYGNFSPDTPAIFFHKTESQNYGYSTLRPKTNEENSNVNAFNTSTFAIFPSPGDLILFHSSLYHSVPKNDTKFNRHSLAFNIVPTDGFGDEESLTELKFN